MFHLHYSGLVSPPQMALILPVMASMLAWLIFFFFTWAFTVTKLERALPSLVAAHNQKVEQSKSLKKGKKKTVSGDVFDVQNRSVSIFHALLCISVTAYQIREEGISIGAVNSQLQVPSAAPALKHQSSNQSSNCSRRTRFCQ
jgi:hypothetical protein